MPTTHITPIRSMATRLDYVSYGNGREGAKHRAAKDPVRALAFECDFGSREEMAAFARRVCLLKGRLNEGCEVRVSWSREELDPNNPDDVAKAMEFGRALADELFPNSPVAITAHGDGVGGCLHIHIEFVNVSNLETLESIHGNGRNHRTVAAISDGLARERGMNVVKVVHTGTWAQRREELVDDIDNVREKLGPDDKWPRALREKIVALELGTKIDAVIREHATEIETLDDYERYLSDVGIGVIRKNGDKGLAFTYTGEVDLEGKSRKRRSKASKILRGFCADKVMETIAQEAERQRAMQREIAERERVEREARDAAAELARIEAERKAAEGEDSQSEADSINAIVAGFAGNAAVRKQKLARDAELARERQLQQAVRMGELSDQEGYWISVDAHALGVNDVWQVTIAESQLVRMAYAGYQVMCDEHRDNDSVTQQLLDFTIADKRDVYYADVTQSVAEEMFEECKRGVRGQWSGEVPREGSEFYARAARNATVNSVRKGSALKTYLFETVSRVIADTGRVLQSFRDYARDALQAIGFIKKKDIVAEAITAEQKRIEEAMKQPSAKSPEGTGMAALKARTGGVKSENKMANSKFANFDPSVGIGKVRQPRRSRGKDGLG